MGLRKPCLACATCCRQVAFELHDETVRQLIEQKILFSALGETEKRAMTPRLRELPAESVKHIAMKMLDLDLGKGQDAIDWLARHLL